MAYTPTSDGTGSTLDRRAFLRLAPLGAAGLGVLVAAACQPASAPIPTPEPRSVAPPQPASTSAQPASTSARPASTSVQPAAAAPTVASAPKPGAAAAGYPVSLPDTSSPRPELPSTGKWIDNAYLKYPANPARMATNSPGRGGSMAYFNQAVYPPATPACRTLGKSASRPSRRCWPWAQKTPPGVPSRRRT